MRDMLKAVSPVIATLLIILIVVASSVIVYLWVSGYTGSLTSASTEQTLREAIKIEAIKTIETDEGSLIILWVRNIGDATVKINSAYYGTTQGYKQANLAYTSSSPPIWGGDIWTFNRETQTIEKTQNGLIFYEDFRDGYNEDNWELISTLEEEENEEGRISIDSNYGLKLTISRPGTSDIEKFGLKLKNNLEILDKEYVIEVRMGKIGSIVNHDYLVETYVSQYVTYGNPHRLSQFVLFYITGWAPLYNYYSSAVTKRRDTTYPYYWSFKIDDYQTCGEWLALFNGTIDRVYVYYNGSYYCYHKDFTYAMYERPYVYLDIGIWDGESGTYSVYFTWIKIYDDPAFTINNLGGGWRVLLVNDSSILGNKTVPAGRNSVLFDRFDDNIVYPLEAHIVIIPTADDASEIGYVIRPGEVKSIALFITEPLPESFSVKVVAENGVEAVFNIKR